MYIETWGDALILSFNELWTGVASFAPRLVAAVVIFVVGWVIAHALGKVVEQILRSLKIDKALQSLGVEEPIERAGIKLDVGVFIGALVKWFVIVVFLTATVDVLGLTQVTDFLKDDVLGYLPNVFVAAMILVVAALIADAVGKLVTGSAKAANLPSSGFLGGVSRWAIWVFAILAALYQLGIAGPMVQTLFIGIVGALALGLGLAFGLGGKDAAAKYLERLRQDIR
ncbi:MAG: Small-conductance mechanosensitive ion channel-like protein [Candidatus Giovannonibacteria bacterium GW2011_GWB1_45_9b]|uniref:Small-conductance mechanosensitive ion channel n=5 Tax=Candidatus Giovannoniibacteriota TaxID=1752738 RepID=A0A1F5X1L1_9BACT|nr:MAG: Small-conductance mechanosensitive ion channel-like protein [Candidatus Giovannonibacteria bacterium GW2011_GWB1_45_9b]OGF73535.1 MAG: hypothetical protein A2W57_03525 [Candidatus Giovannonibacteria bacterium RIFCSPHIGHO2_02_43_16]OGF81794.1 MAG: hypothetical protein A2W48_00245 [Candidatus Giovannonibacteria bacterium RIFCSPHIGHO2_12_44_12]OGF86040.1 MAG: hypothetical protein A2Z63_03190 [Candidatus Giovannonibacteria bacterium RIFCSPLOWO2_02_44_8]OGF95737.1 MAG: hypothetical protein A